jgi:hypothetical protein
VCVSPSAICAMNQKTMARKWSYTNIDGTEGNHSGSVPVAYPGILLLGQGGGVSTNSVGDRQNGDLGAVAP